MTEKKFKEIMHYEIVQRTELYFDSYRMQDWRVRKENDHKGHVKYVILNYLKKYPTLYFNPESGIFTYIDNYKKNKEENEELEECGFINIKNKDCFNWL